MHNVHDIIPDPLFNIITMKKAMSQILRSGCNSVKHKEPLLES